MHFATTSHIATQNMKLSDINAVYVDVLLDN
ncbi:hypothetical protein VVNSV5830_02309 [Vibrio vulnificus]|nr:hypothetical protein VVORL1506_01201 [Vibrio vulnificus]OJI25059.1 hypothetical protein VVNSV5830_02309 [Vibrio vulnificus]